MTPIPYVKHCSWDHLLITWEPRSNAVLYYCAKVLYFFIFLEIVLAVPDKGQLCSFIVKGETERCRKSDFWRGSIWGDRKERGLNISILKIATSNYDFNAILHLCKNVWNKVFPIIQEHESCLLARRDSFKSMKCEILLQMRVCVFYVGLIHYLRNPQVLFSTKIILKLGSTVPFTHLKIILL